MCHNVVRVVLVHLNQGRGKPSSANTTGAPSSASNATKVRGSDACGSDACGLSIPTAATSCSTTSWSCYLAWRWRCSALVFGVSVFLQSYLAEASVLEMFLQTASDIAKAPVPYLGEPAMSCWPFLLFDTGPGCRKPVSISKRWSWWFGNLASKLLGYAHLMCCSQWSTSILYLVLCLELIMALKTHHCSELRYHE